VVALAKAVFYNSGTAQQSSHRRLRNKESEK
jgi:hypothetical protein